jgi:hypothetical protein
MQTSRVPFQIVRGLRFPSDDGMPVFEMAFEMQAQASTQELADAVGIAADKLPHQFRLLPLVAGKEHLQSVKPCVAEAAINWLHARGFHCKTSMRERS